jgi:hypothetical protein
MAENQNEILIHKIKSEIFMSISYAEIQFNVSDILPYIGFKLILKGKNSGGTNHFSLSGLEFDETLII